MANTFITLKTGPVTRAALGILHLSTVLPQLCYRDSGVDGNIAPGDTISVRLPASFTAATFVRGTGVVAQEATQTKVPVVFDTIYDVTVVLTSEDLTQELTNFNQSITQPAMVAMAEKAEAVIAAEVAGNVTASATILDASPVASFIEAAMTLTAAKAPLGGRFAVVGTTLATTLLTDEKLLRYDASGSTDALREAKIGRVGGVDVYVSPYVGADAGFISAVDGIGFFSRAIAPPMGANNASASSFEGVAMRTVMDYDVTYKQDVVSYDSLFAAKVLDENRVVLLAGEGS